MNVAEPVAEGVVGGVAKPAAGCVEESEAEGVAVGVAEPMREEGGGKKRGRRDERRM